jgi:hypothetical protein
MAAEKRIDPEVAQLWGEEAERRYQEFLDGKVEAVPGEEHFGGSAPRLMRVGLAAAPPGIYARAEPRR